jgi:hypothetical protein
MTRETKVGLVVAGSFLCAVGGYLGLRMRSADTPPAPTEQAVTAPLPTEPETPPPATLVMEPPPSSQPAPTPAFNPTPVEPLAKTPDPVNPAPAPTALVDLPPQPVTPTPVETPKPEPTKQPEPAPVVPAVKQPDPPPETPKAIDPLPEFKAVELKQDPPKAVDPPPAPVQEAPKPVEPLPPAKEIPKPEEPKPFAPSPGSASLIHEPAPATAPPPRPLPDPLPNLQPAGGTRPAPKAPASDSFLEEEYRLQSGDTFAGVSKRFYFSDKYSIALQQYNRDYPIGSPNLKQDPPRLAAGTSVWIPPIRVLEKRYPTMIADYKPLTNAAVAGPATAASPTWTPTPARQVAASTKTYRVREGGESMIDIARRMLNNPQAWNTIYQLNPSLNANASAPIPAGTLLRVPGDARD